jgi:hypothetical protein
MYFATESKRSNMEKSVRHDWTGSRFRAERENTCQEKGSIIKIAP